MLQYNVFVIFVVCSSDFQLCCLEDQGSPSVTQYVVSVGSSSLLLIVLKLDLFVYRDDSLTSYRVIMRTEQPTKYFVPI